MAKKRTTTEIKGIFSSEGETSWSMKWSVDEEKLKDIVKNDECSQAILDKFEKMNDDPHFNAQVVEVNKVHRDGDEAQHYVISLGHFIYAHHYTYVPESDRWHVTILNQDFFEDIVKPFQNTLKKK